MVFNTRNKKLFLFITITIFTVYCLLPSGIHLKLCFGDDGHLDISTEVCTSDRFLPIKTDSYSTSEEHHEDCSDVILFCLDNFSYDENSYLLHSNTNSKIKDLHIITASINPYILSRTSIDRFKSEGFVSERCDYHPTYLDSVVLLI